MVSMDPYETALAEKYGFIVGEDKTGHYIVTDPQMPKRKNKYIGGNLYSLMLTAIDTRSRAKATIITADFTPKVKTIKAQPEPPEPEPEPIKAQEADPEQPTKPLKAGKLYMIKQMLIDDPNLNNNDILKKLKSIGLAASLATISTTRSDFLNTIRVIKRMGWWKGDC